MKNILFISLLVITFNASAYTSKPKAEWNWVKAKRVESLWSDQVAKSMLIQKQVTSDNTYKITRVDVSVSRTQPNLYLVKSFMMVLDSRGRRLKHLGYPTQSALYNTKSSKVVAQQSKGWLDSYWFENNLGAEIEAEKKAKAVTAAKKRAEETALYVAEQERKDAEYKKHQDEMKASSIKAAKQREVDVAIRAEEKAKQDAIKAAAWKEKMKDSVSIQDAIDFVKPKLDKHYNKNKMYGQIKSAFVSDSKESRKALIYTYSDFAHISNMARTYSNVTLSDVTIHYVIAIVDDITGKTYMLKSAPSSRALEQEVKNNSAVIKRLMGNTQIKIKHIY